MMKQEGDGRMKKRRRVDYPINSGANVSDCQDLLARILLPLPARTLITFKLVSIDFHFVISDPLFASEHVRFHHMNNKFLRPTGLYFYNSFTNNNPQIYYVSISNPPRSMPSLFNLENVGFLLDRQFKILQSCNGLLLCSFDNENPSDFLSPQPRLYCVCNPTTHDFVILPELPSVEASSKSRKEEVCRPFLTLAFDPLQSHVYKVFGFRVVKNIAHQWSCELLVYLSQEGGGHWREFGCQFNIPVSMKRIRHGVFHDGGKITWITEKGFIHLNVQARGKITWITEKGFIHLNVQARTVIIKKHTSIFQWEKTRFFGNCINGSLHMVKLSDSCGVRVYQLNLESLKWEFRSNPCPQRNIEQRLSKFVGENYLNHWMPRYSQSPKMYQILAVEDGEEQLILAIPGMVIRYHRYSRDSVVLLRQLPRHFSEDFSSGWVTSFQFVETLCHVRPSSVRPQ